MPAHIKNINNKLRNCFIEEFLKSSVRRNKRGINIAVSLLSVANAVSKNANLILSLKIQQISKLMKRIPVLTMTRADTSDL
jgi:hypothetical protein